MEFDHNKLPRSFWLFLPWITVAAIALAYTTGVANWIFDRLDWAGGLVQRNMGWGMLLVTFLSSARWEYLRFSSERSATSFPVGRIIGMAILITVAQCSVALGVFFVGCLVIAAKWH
jgi:hypothetical protein